MDDEIANERMLLPRALLRDGHVVQRGRARRVVGLEVDLVLHEPARRPQWQSIGRSERIRHVGEATSGISARRSVHNRFR